MGRLLIIAGLVIAFVGLVITIAGKIGLGHLPGDIVIKRRNFALYIPIASSILISVLLTLLFNLIRRR